MGKSFKGFSKALSLILAVAMVVTCVPTSAYAAELLSVDESEDLLISNDAVAEESSDALVTDDASASEEKSSSLIDTQKEADLAAAPEENTAGEEDLGADGDDPTPVIVTDGGHKLHIYKGTDTAKTDRQNTAPSSRVANAKVYQSTLAYGVDVATAEYTVRAEYTSGLDQDYTALSWKIVSARTDTVDDHSKATALSDAAVDALTEVTSFPKGFSITASGEKVTVSGTPLETCPFTAYYAVGTDTEPDDEKASQYKVIVPVELTVNAPSVTAMAKDAKDSSAENKLASSKYVGFNKETVPGTQDAVAMGYTVLDEDPANAGKNGVPANVKPVTITLKGSTISATSPMSVKVSLDGDDADKFATPVVTGTSYEGGYKLDKNTDIAIKVAPIEGLAEKATAYQAKVVLTSDGFLNSSNKHIAEIDLKFTVGSNLSFTVKQGEDKQEDTIKVFYVEGDSSKRGTDPKQDLAGKTVYTWGGSDWVKESTSTSPTWATNGTKYYADALFAGEVEVGEELDADSNITINAKGGAGKLEFADFDDGKLPKGITASKAEGTKDSTLTLSGTADAEAYKWATDTIDGKVYDGIAVSVSDKGSTASLSNVDNSLLGGYAIVVQPADVTYANSLGESLEDMTVASPETGANSFAYTWTTEAEYEEVTQPTTDVDPTDPSNLWYEKDPSTGAYVLSVDSNSYSAYAPTLPCEQFSPVTAKLYKKSGSTYTAATLSEYFVTAGGLTPSAPIPANTYYELDSTTNTFDLTADSTVDGAKTYYEVSDTYYTYNGPYYTEATVAAGGATAKFKVTNNSSKPLTFKAGVYESDYSTISSKFDVVNKSVTIAAGATGYIDVVTLGAVTPTVPLNDILSITGDGIRKTNIELTAEAVADDVEAITTTSLKDAEVGVPYTTTLQATESTTGTWSIESCPNGDGSNTTTAKYILDTYGLTLNKNTGVLSGTPKQVKASPGFTIKVKKGNATADLQLVVKAASEGISLTSDSKEISKTKKLKLADIAGDSEVGSEAVITIGNNTSVDLGDLTATITKVTGAASKSDLLGPITATTPGDVYKYFRLVTVDEDGEEVVTDDAGADSGATTYNGNSVTLLKDKNYSLKLESTAPVDDETYDADYNVEPSELTELDADDDPYEVTVEISGTNIATKSFIATLRVNSTLDIVPGTVSLKTFEVGTEVEETTKENWTAKYDTTTNRGQYTFVAVENEAIATTSDKLNPNTDEVIFSWAKAEGAELDIKDSGLTLSTKGVIGGTPVKAGVYKVVVTATGYGEKYKDLVGSKEFEIEVLGSATLGVSAVVGATTQALAGNEVVVLQGAAIGDTIDSNSGVQINVVATNQAITKGLKITVEDVDTRTAEGKKKEKDVHAGSTNFIGTSVSTIATIAKNGSASFRVVPKSTSKAGDYLAKVTISGDEATTTYFFVEYIVSEKLAISTAGATLRTGVGDDYRLMLESTGANNAPNLTWSEVQLKATADMKRADGTYVYHKGDYPNLLTNAAGTLNPDDKNEKIKAAGANGGDTKGLTGLALKPDQANPTGVDDIDLEVSTKRAWIGDDTQGRKKGHAVEQGSFNIKVLAETDYLASGHYKQIDDSYELEKNAAGTGFIERELKGKSGAAITSAKYFLVGNDLTATADDQVSAEATFGAQKATASFVLTVNETEKVVISDVATNDATVIEPTYCTNGKASEAAATIANDAKNKTKNATDAMKDFTSRATGTYKSDGITYVTVTGYTFKEVPVKGTQETLALTIANGSAKNIATKIALKNGTSSKFELSSTTVTVNAKNVGTVSVRPTTDTLKTVGTYTDTVVITGNDMKTIEFPVSITVAPVSREIAAYQRGEKNTGTTYDPEKDTEVVDKTSTLKGNVTFKATEEAVTPTEEVVVFFKNTGNSSIDYSMIEVKDANGTGYTSASEKRKLFFGATTNPSTTTALSGALAANAWLPVYVKITPDAAATAGEQTAYLKVDYDTDKEIVIPVTFTVFETGLDLNVNVTPTDNTVEILKGSKTETDPTKKYYAEGTDFASVAPEFEIKNNNTGDASKSLYNVTATLSSTADFEFVYDDATKINAAGDVLKLDNIAAAASAKFKVAPKSTIRQGTDRTVEITISSPSLATDIKKTVKITVIPGTDYTEKVASTSATALTYNAQDAYRLYRGLVVSKKIAEASAAGQPGVWVADTTHVNVVLDEGNLTVKFTLTTPLGGVAYSNAIAYQKAANITATVEKKTGDIGKSSFTVTLNETEKSTVKSTLGDPGAANDNDISFFNKMTFNFYSKVLFELNDASAYFTKSVLDYKTNKNVTLYSDVAATTVITVDDDTDYKTVRALRIEVPNNTALGATFGTVFPAAEKEGRAFDSWKYSGDTYNANTIIKEDINTQGTDELAPSWHSHKYTTNPKDEKYAKWTWTKLAGGDYTASLTLYCTENDCPDYEGSKVELTDVSTPPITITKDIVEATCEHGRSVKFSAEVTYPAVTGTKFTSDYYDETGEDQPLGHDWKDAVVVWAANGSGENGAYTKSDVTVSRTCKVDPSHVANLTVVSVNENGKVEPKCDVDGEVTYTVTYTDVDKFGKPASNVTSDVKDGKKVVLKAKGHNKTPDLTVESFDETTLKANVTAKCPDCGKELYKGELTATKNEDGTYKFTFTGVDEKTYTVDWSNHEHKWGAPSWTWASKDSATATFTCSVGKETKDVTATIVAVKTNSKGDTQYKATVTGPDGKEYSDLKWYDKNGNPTSGGGISIEGLEEEYKFAGTAIKPAISVVDNDLGITLAEGTDYKISYKDNTKIGTATITVNGKGNYTGKNVTAQFKIVSATEGIEGLATKVNKVEKIAFNPTYTGEPQAPEKVTVVADGESIVYEWNGSEYQKITDTTKDVGITIVNNVNAGTATVAAVGADGKAKKANFKINKVDLSAVSAEQLAVEVEEEAAYLVKGAKPGVSVTYTPEGGSAIELINGQDFKVEYKYANKKNASEGNTIKIKGYGANFTKAKEVADKPFKIVKHALQDDDIVSVEAYTDAKAKAIKVVVKDSAGVVIPAKQYEVHVFTEEGLEISTDKKAKLEAGKKYTIQVKASATGNLEGEASVDVTAQANIGKAKATLSATLKKNGVAYTGEPIDLTNYQSGELIIDYFEKDITVNLKGVGELKYGEDFEVAGYVNNVNKGTMTVYVRGISDKCSGTLGIKVKISAKTMKKAAE